MRSDLPGRPGHTNCPFGHGIMELLEGWWALTGVNVRTEPLNALVRQQTTTVTGNNRAYALRAWRCPDCGNVQLFDGQL